MRIIRHIRILILSAVSVIAVQGVVAQHTLGFIAGYGMGSGRFDPKQETRAIWGLYSGGLTWRYYGQQRYVGGFGVDLEFHQQAFSFATNYSQVDEKDPANYLYYTRRINSVVLPVVWQPHFYLLKNHVRVYLEAAATFFYNFSSTWEQEYFLDSETKQKGSYGGNYAFKVPRDNRWGYGLAGGGGVAFLIRRFEVNFRVRYYFGYSDIVRNRNRYYDNSSDGPENPFYTTPMRSPLDNLTISVGLNYRFNKEGFETWKPRPKREKNREGFKFGQ